MAAFKELTGWIKNYVTSLHYGEGGNPAAMRQEALKSKVYRQLEEDNSPQLIEIGATKTWRDCQNAPRTKHDEAQFDFTDFPQAIDAFKFLKRQNYVPKTESETTEVEGGVHLEVENMTQAQVEQSGNFYMRSGQEVMKRGRDLLQIAQYFTDMGIPQGMTLREWKELRFKVPKKWK